MKNILWQFTILFLGVQYGFSNQITDVKLFQGDSVAILKIYFSETLRGVTNVKIPKSQTDVNDWRKYNYNLEVLFDNFSKNIIKQDNKWIKKATKNKIKKDLKKLNALMDKIK